MINIKDLLEAFFTSTIISLLSVPLMRVISEKTGYLDRPQDNKRHAHAMPLLGGVAIFFAFVAAILSQSDVIALFSMSNRVLAILCGAFILVVLGLIDDKIGMGPEIKLLGQFIAAMIVYKSGIRITFLGNYYLNLFVTYLWIIGMTNAFNLLDNMNGLSAGIGIIASFFFGIISWMNGQGIASIISFCLCGSCLGFLRYNFPKAKIFMGDTGSLMIGFILATIAIYGNWKSMGLVTSLSVPLLVLAYPIFDTTLVTIVRIVQGRSIFQGGKDHSSHRLALMGFKAKNTVFLVYIICILLGLAALFVSKTTFKVAVLIIIIAAAALILLGIRLSLIDTGRFGRKKGTGNIENR
jgi:UDP-GlcNAc:undecaprenyl-phosphate/decaprenyl-phosphate GlcNAc-1-phosphate transferase